MKYIRTKSGQLFTVVEKIDKTEFKHSFKYLYRIKEVEKIINGSDIIVDVNVVKEADTIKELIDEYVAIYPEYPELNSVIDPEYFFSHESSEGEYEYYGSIWVNGNLIKVAKKNEKGDLYLI